jgi:hypothetical protein
MYRCPTAPVAPKMATFRLFGIFAHPLTVSFYIVLDKKVNGGFFG